MERIVYILGAGFSAPLKLPVISDFFEKAKELNKQNPRRYKGYKILDKTVRDFSIIKNYCKVDLFNIEQLLSILDMRLFINNEEKLRNEVVDAIAEVIEGSTPDLEFTDRVISTTIDDLREDRIFEGNYRHNGYFAFVSHAHGIKVRVRHIEDKRPTGNRNKKIKNSTSWETDTNSEVRYDIISLNYDMVLEKVCNFLNTNPYIKRRSEKLRFKRKRNDRIDEQSPYLIKLHGSVDEKETIVPPTWRKYQSNNKIKEQWEIAAHLLENADHIVFIGYSLPENDNHIRCLLQSSIKTTQITSITSINRDPEAIERYKNFFPNIQTGGETIQYLERFTRTDRKESEDEISFSYNRKRDDYTIF